MALSLAASLAVAACGSSSSSSSSSGGSQAGRARPASSSGSSGGGTINGAGSTLRGPDLQPVGPNLSSQGLTVNYNPLGSGAGIAGLQSSTLDFAGSDPAMKPSRGQSAKGPVLQFPVAFGAITVSYNLSGVKSGLKLDGKTLGDIFLGKVKTWNDAEIKSLNPGVSLPSTSITVVHRSDSSGTTKGFTTFLADYSPDRGQDRRSAGQDGQVADGTGAPKNAGVAAAVKQTPGSIGYVEQAYALQNGFTYAAVKNKSGAFIVPTLAAASAAADGITVPPDLAISTIDSPNKAAYPITSQTFVVIYKDMCKAGRSQSAASGVEEVPHLRPRRRPEGGAGSCTYAPLPASLLAKTQAQLSQIELQRLPGELRLRRRAQ